MNERVLQNAAQLAQGPKPELARPLITDLLATAPDDADALTLLGIIEQRAGNIPAALAALGRARECDPSNPARLGNHALALKRAGHLNEAIAALQEALALRPRAPVTLANLGACLIETGRPGEAVPHLERALEIDDRHFDSLNNLAIALTRIGKAAEALRIYDRALRLRADHLETRLNRIDALGVLDSHAAVNEVKAILARCPGHPRASNQLGMLLEAQGERDDAIEIYRSSIDKAGLFHPIGVNLTRILVQTGRYREAITLADQLISDLPSVTTPMALKCAALARAGLHTDLDAMLDLNRFVKIIDFEKVDGFASRKTFDAELARELSCHTSLTFDPKGLVTRQGWQSDDLADATTPALTALINLAKNAISTYLTNLPESDHPFQMARPDKWSLTMWGTILNPGGEVGAHIHAPNWLSGVYYPDLPNVVSASEEGWLVMGALPKELGGGGIQRRYEPAAGRMILFPSYIWHGTLPFSGDQPRLSIAFDCVPMGVGRPHRLERQPDRSG